MTLCECNSDGVCVKCGEPRRNCNAKRHCPSSATNAPIVLSPRLPVGTAIAAVLSPLGLKPGSECSCSTTRAVLDYNGAAWTIRNIRHVASSISANARRLGKWCPRWLAACVVIAGVVVAWRIGPRKVPTLAKE